MFVMVVVEENFIQTSCDNKECITHMIHYMLNKQYICTIDIGSFRPLSRKNACSALNYFLSVREHWRRCEPPSPQLSIAMLDHAAHVPDRSVHVLRVPHCVRNI